MSLERANDLPKTIDLRLLDTPKALGAHVYRDVVVDPGPESTVERLLDALGDWQPRAILLTHIHFDHAGATGRLCELWPDAEVWVHEHGAKHLVDPTRLVSSARRVFGEAFDELWGEVAPVPAERMRVLTGGEQLGDWRVAYTPGHAVHHVCYLDESSGVAFTGDTTGCRIDGGPTLPPTPPPDVHVGDWHDSLRTIASWQPRAIAFMHFGVNATDPLEQIEGLHETLDTFAEQAAQTDGEGFVRFVRNWFVTAGGGSAPELTGGYSVAAPLELQWAGLDRYWRKVVGR